MKLCKIHEELNKNKIINKFFLIYLCFIMFFIFSTFNVENYLHPFKEIVLIFLTIFIGFSCILYYVFHQKEIYKVAFVLILIFGIVFVFISPFNSISDEPEHFVRSEITSRGIFFPEYFENENQTLGFKTIDSIVNIPRDKTVFETDWDDQKINHELAFYDSAFIQNPFYGYIAQGFGIFIAKILNLNNIWMLWFGRLCNLLLYGTISAIAIKKTPIMKIPLFIVVCLPLSVILAASMSTDALSISLSLFTIAYFFYLYKSEDYSITKKNILSFFILVLILALTKVTLGAFAILILAISKRKFKIKRDYYLGFAVIGLVLLILILWTKFYAVDSLYLSWRASKFKSYNVSPSGQINYIFHNTSSVLSFLHIGEQINNLVIGLNKIYTYFPIFSLLSFIYIIFFAYISFFYPFYEKISKKAKILSLITILTIFFGTYIIQFLTWASVGTTDLVNCGVSTRYFIPFFGLIPFMFNRNMNFKIKNIDMLIITLVISFLGGIIVYIASLAY